MLCTGDSCEGSSASAGVTEDVDLRGGIVGFRYCGRNAWQCGRGRKDDGFCLEREVAATRREWEIGDSCGVETLMFNALNARLRDC